jgi:hypothetical protein
MNMELWNKVKKRFEEHPECVDMSIIQSECGTVGCIAGWTIFEAGEELGGLEPWYRQAGRLLKIDYFEGSDLFFLHRWPDRYKDLYHESIELDGHPARAVLAAMNAFERGEF